MPKTVYKTIKVGRQRLITILPNATEEYERVPPLFMDVNAYLLAMGGKVPEGSILLIPKKAPDPIVRIVVPVLDGKESKVPEEQK